MQPQSFAFELPLIRQTKPAFLPSPPNHTYSAHVPYGRAHCVCIHLDVPIAKVPT